MGQDKLRHRKARPGAMFYPSDTLALAEFRMMSLAERGLWITMMFECWANMSVPNDPRRLALVLGLELNKVNEALTENLLYFFEETGDEYTSPDLEHYRDEVDELSEKRSKAGKKGMASRYAQPKDEDNHVPHQEIIELFHEALPELPQIRGWTDARKKLLRARWEEEPKRQSLDWWKRFFEYVDKSDYLCGRSSSWKADLPWILKQENFLKVIEGRYHNDGTP